MCANFILKKNYSEKYLLVQNDKLFYNLLLKYYEFVIFGFC